MTKITKLSKADFNKILRNYNIGTYVSHKLAFWSLGNTVYFLTTNKGKFVMKIHERVRTQHLDYVLKVEDFARKHKILVPLVIKTRSGSKFSIRKRKRITIQQFVEGSEAKMSGTKTVKMMGAILGKVDKVLLKIPLKGKFTWDDAQFSGKFWGIKKIPNFEFKKAARQLHVGLTKINKDKIRKSVIHSDLGGNFLMKNGKLMAIIDWEEAHEDYLVFEPAIFIAAKFITLHGIKRNQIKLFMSEYQKYIKLNSEEKKAIYYFILYRYLSIITWVTQHAKTRKANKKHINFVKQSITKYNTLSKVPIKEFISWIP